MRHEAWGKGRFVIAALCVAASAFSCQQKIKHPPRLAAVEPKVRATIVTIRTTVQPANRSFVHSLVIANNRARSGDEVDAWRLFDLKNQTVTYVDDVAKTYRSVPLATIISQRREAIAQPLQEQIPAAQFAVTGAKRVVDGIETSQSVIRAGSYVRELWIGSHPQIPPGLFAMMMASAPASSPIAPMMRQVDAALIEVRGFPLVDRSELPMGDKTLVVEHSVIKFDQRDIPQSWLNVPGSYKGLPQTTEPGARPPSSSSPRRDQTTPATESRSSATTRTVP
jgi:hypothetical protein